MTDDTFNPSRDKPATVKHTESKRRPSPTVFDEATHNHQINMCSKRGGRPDRIKDAGFVVRWLTLAFFEISKHRLFKGPLRRRGILSVSNLCIKIYPFKNLGEAHAMQFVAQHTSIPVPKVLCAFIHKGVTYIVMSRIEGQQAQSG